MKCIPKLILKTSLFISLTFFPVFFGFAKASLKETKKISPSSVKSDKKARQKDNSPFSKADSIFKGRSNPQKGREALDLYRQIFESRKEDPEAAWRLAMATYFVGARAAQDDKEKLKVFAEGRDVASQCAKNFPERADCHFWTAINMALYGQTQGIMKMAMTLNDIRKHLKRSIEIDPTYMWGGAYRLEGDIERILPGIFGGSNDRARKNFELAIQNGPDEPLNYLFLARLLVDQFKEKEKALEIARTGLKLSHPTPDRVEAVDAMKDLKTFISKNQ